MAKVNANIGIDEQYWPQLIAGILREHPIPQVDVLDDNDIPTGETVPQYTEIQQVVALAMKYLAGESLNGLKKLVFEGADLDLSVIPAIIQENIDAAK